MIVRWWRAMFRPDGRAEEARRAREDAENRLGDVRRQWGEVSQAGSTLASWVEQGLRGGRAS